MLSVLKDPSAALTTAAMVWRYLHRFVNRQSDSKVIFGPPVEGKKRARGQSLSTSSFGHASAKASRSVGRNTIDSGRSISRRTSLLRLDKCSSDRCLVGASDLDVDLIKSAYRELLDAEMIKD